MIIIPNELINNISIGEYRILVYLYFQVRKGLDNITGYSCQEIVTWCGYTPNRRKGKINDKINQTINMLDKLGYINLINQNITTSTNYNKCFVTNMHNKYITVDICKIEQIRNYFINANTIAASKLVLVYSFLINSKSNSKAIDEVCLYLGLSKLNIENSIKTLKELNLININFKFIDKYYLYKFINTNNNVIYIGKTKNLVNRINCHFNNGHLPVECYNDTVKILYYCFNTQIEMDINEIYYINEFMPKYNIEFKPKEKIKSNEAYYINDYDWIEFPINNNI